ncbi:MAG: recombination-associated protein RdgC [Leucothrix sp.]
MWFKNLYLYQFEKEFDQDADTLHEALSKKPFVDCSATQRESMGWVTPLGKNSDAYTHAVNDFILLTMARQERLLPASVVRETLQERVTEIQETESRRVGSKEKKELTERIEDELLPRAFKRTQKLDAWIDLKGGWLVVNTSSSTRAENFATLLRKTIGSLPVVPIKTEAVSPVLTDWLVNYKLPEPFEMGDECEMKSLGDDAGIVAFRKHELGTDEVKSNIETGKTVSKLALVWDRKISFVVSDDLVIKKLKFLDVLDEKMNEEDPQSHEERVDIEFTLMTGEVSKLIPDLNGQFNSQ